MPIIRLETFIKAPIERVFDLCRSIDLHKISTDRTNEEAIEGKVSGLIGLKETVTWRAKHFWVYQKLKVEITEFNYPNYFSDEMISGAFKSFKHKHEFKDQGDFTLMLDTFDYKSPLGFLGKVADSLFLKNYMTNFLSERNKIIKEFAETEKWKLVLKK